MFIFFFIVWVFLSCYYNEQEPNTFYLEAGKRLPDVLMKKVLVGKAE